VTGRTSFGEMTKGKGRDRRHFSPAIGVDSTPSTTRWANDDTTRINMNSLTTVGARVIDSGLVRCNPSRRRKVGGMWRIINPPSPQISIRHNIADEDRDDCEEHDDCGDYHDELPPPAWPVSRRCRQTPPYNSSLREKPPLDSSSPRLRQPPSSSSTNRASGDSTRVLAVLRAVSMIEPYVSSLYLQRIFTSGLRNLEAMNCNVVDVEIALRSCFDIDTDMIRDITIAAQAIVNENDNNTMKTEDGDTTMEKENGDSKDDITRTTAASGETRMEDESVNDQSDGTDDLCHRMDRVLSSYTEIGCQTDGDNSQIFNAAMSDMTNGGTNEFHERLNRLLSATEMTVGLKRMQKIMILVEQMMVEKENLKHKYNLELDKARVEKEDLKRKYDHELDKARQTLLIRDKQLEQYRMTLNEAELTNSVFEKSIRKLVCSSKGKDVLIRQLATRVCESESMNKKILKMKSDMKSEYRAKVHALSTSIALIQRSVEVTDVNHSVLVTSSHQDKMEPTPKESEKEENDKHCRIEVGACLSTIVNDVEAKEIERLQTEMRRLEIEFTIAQSSYHNAATHVSTTKTRGSRSK
jgi:hypothetical protein